MDQGEGTGGVGGRGGSALLPASDGAVQAGYIVGDAAVTAPVTWRELEEELAARTPGSSPEPRKGSSRLDACCWVLQFRWRTRRSREGGGEEVRRRQDSGVRSLLFGAGGRRRRLERKPGRLGPFPAQKLAAAAAARCLSWEPRPSGVGWSLLCREGGGRESERF